MLNPARNFNGSGQKKRSIPMVNTIIKRRKIISYGDLEEKELWKRPALLHQPQLAVRLVKDNDKMPEESPAEPQPQLEVQSVEESDSMPNKAPAKSQPQTEVRLLKDTDKLPEESPSEPQSQPEIHLIKDSDKMAEETLALSQLAQTSTPLQAKEFAAMEMDEAPAPAEAPAQPQLVGSPAIERNMSLASTPMSRRLERSPVLNKDKVPETTQMQLVRSPIIEKVKTPAEAPTRMQVVHNRCIEQTETPHSTPKQHQSAKSAIMEKDQTPVEAPTHKRLVQSLAIKKDLTPRATPIQRQPFMMSVMDEAEMAEEDWEAFAQPEYDEDELLGTIFDTDPQQIPIERIYMRHRTLEEVFCHAGRMVGNSYDKVSPQDIVMTAENAPRVRSFVEWADAISDDMECPINKLVVIKASHNEDLISGFEARIRSLEAENESLKSSSMQLQEEKNELKNESLRLEDDKKRLKSTNVRLEEEKKKLRIGHVRLEDENRRLRRR